MFKKLVTFTNIAQSRLDVANKKTKTKTKTKTKKKDKEKGAGWQRFFILDCAPTDSCLTELDRILGRSGIQVPIII